MLGIPSPFDPVQQAPKPPPLTLQPVGGPWGSGNNGLGHLHQKDPGVQGSHGGGTGKHTGFPGDAEYRNDIAQLAAQRLNFMDQFGDQRQGVQQNYLSRRRDIREAHPFELRNILSNYGSRGMGFSTGYTGSVGVSERNYGNTLADLATQKLQAMTGLHTAMRAFNRTAKVQKVALRQAATDRLTAKAGELGLGKNKHLTPKELWKIIHGKPYSPPKHYKGN